MRNRTALFFVLSLAIATGGALSHAADSVSCPPSITTRQELTAAPAGWKPMLDDAPHDLAGITFYDGPPAEKASLVYDRMDRGKGVETATWTFAARKDRPIWLTCSYAGTAVQLARSLPSETTTCTVVYDPKEHIAGLPAIKALLSALEPLPRVVLRLTGGDKTVKRRFFREGVYSERVDALPADRKAGRDLIARLEILPALARTGA